jgi:hypothetical protein
LISSLTQYNRYRRLCHRFCFLNPGSHKRNICNWQLLFSLNILTMWDYSISLSFSKQEMICCSAHPTLMMCALIVLDFIFVMILFIRCLSIFMRCSLHENRGVCSYFIQYTKLEPTGVPKGFSLIVYNI